MSAKIRIFQAVVSICAALSPMLGVAAEFEQLRLGFGGIGKVGRWLPVSATIDGLPPEESVELHVAFSDPRGDLCVAIVDQGKPDSKGSISLAGRFQVGRLKGAGTVRVVSTDKQETLASIQVLHDHDSLEFDASKEVQTTLQLHKLTTDILLHFGEVAGIPELVRNVAAYSKRDGVLLNAATVSSVDVIPNVRKVLDSVDALLLTDDLQISTAHTKLIQNWVLSGGRLIVSSAKNVGEFCRTPAGEWIDSLFDIGDEPVNIRDMASVQSFVSGARPLLTNRKAWPLAVINSDQMEIQINSLNGPVMGSRSFGGGTVTFIGIDLNRRPVDDWKSLPQFYEVLLLGDSLSRESVEKKTSRISQSGVSDIATQMLAAVDAKPPRGEWSTWAVMGMIVGYLLLIGPLDYLIVNHVLGKPHLTWVTFPAMVVLGAIGILNAAGSDESRTLNQLHLVDVCVDEDKQMLQTRSWMSVSSSLTERIDINAEPALTTSGESNQVDLIWSGRPEDVYGGMYREGGAGLGRQNYMLTSMGTESLQSVPMLPNGSRGLYSTWLAAPDNNIVTSNLFVSGYGLLKGTFELNLPDELSEWLICHGNRVYRVSPDSKLETLASGVTCDISANMYASDLKAFLNGSRKSSEPSKTDNASNRGRTMVATPYDTRSDDELYVMTMASFFNAAGGISYTGLTQSMLKQMELSDTIRLNHAVIIGLIDSPATNLNVNSEQLKPGQSKTIVRIFLPVDRRPSEGQARSRDEIEKEKSSKNNNAAP